VRPINSWDLRSCRQ
jgi:hypothetical protein